MPKEIGKGSVIDEQAKATFTDFTTLNQEEGPPPKTQEELYEELIVAVKRERYEVVKYDKILVFALTLSFSNIECVYFAGGVCIKNMD